jgi:mannosyltransferase OCH1-like enzyme
VVRLYALVNYGGVYMDTDVEVLSSLDPFLNEQAFSGFESFTQVPTGIMASEKDFPLFKFLLSSYTGRHFIKKDGSFDMTTNVDSITNELSKRGFQANNQLQRIDGFALFPKDYFCPLNGSGQGEPNFSKNTVCIHHFAGSWISKKNRFHRHAAAFLGKLFGEKFVMAITDARKNKKK